MSFIATLRTRCRHFLRGLFHRDQVEHELREELAGYVDMLAEQKRAAGMSPREARRAARLEFGGIDKVTEEVRDVRLSAWVDSVVRDSRRCFLSLLRNRPFTGVAVLTVALGIGASVTVFTLVNAVLLRPLPIPDSERLVLLGHVAPGQPQFSEMRMSDALYFLYAEESRTLDGVAGFSDYQVSLTSPEDPQRVQAAWVTASFFDVMRMQPRIGRAFTDEDDRPGGASVVVLADGLWRTRFGADPGVVGRAVEIDGANVEVVGVMPPGFAFSLPETQLWLPMRLDPEDLRLGYFGFNGVGRIADGSTLEQVRTELGAMLSNLAEIFPDQPGARTLAENTRPLIERVRTWVVGDIEAILWILLGAVGIVLLIACANVTNLFLVRSEARHGEVAIRAALGESRGQLVGSVLLESLVLGVAGGIVALLLALGAVRLLVGLDPPGLPRLGEISIDTNVLLFGFVVSVAAGLLFGLVPALRLSAVAASGCMTPVARGGTVGRERQFTRRGLVVIQIALALILLVGSGLALRSFQRLASVDAGFDPVDVLAFGLALPHRDYDTPASRLNFYRQVVDRLRTLPGAVAAAAAGTVPLDGPVSSAGYSIEGRPRRAGDEWPVFAVKNVSPGYFDAMRIALVEGRVFDRLDEERDAPVVIVSRSLARAYWPGESGLGKRIRMGNPPNEEEGEQWSRIVGVVDDVHETSLHEDPPEIVYSPPVVSWGSNVANVPWPMRYIVRAPNIAALAGAVREAVRELDPALPMYDVETLETLVGRARGTRAFVMVLLIVAAGLALVLGAVGLYGVVSYTVAQRRREIAIRMAVGAQASDLTRLVLAEAAGLALAGVTLGIAVALAVTHQLQAILFETSPLDPAVFIGVSVFLTLVCLLASGLPTRRATRVDPTAALRVE